MKYVKIITNGNDITTKFSEDNLEIEIDISMLQVFLKKFARRKQGWTTKITFHALDLRNNGYLALVETKTKTRAMPTGQY